MASLQHFLRQGRIQDCNSLLDINYIFKKPIVHPILLLGNVIDVNWRHRLPNHPKWTHKQ